MTNELGVIKRLKEDIGNAFEEVRMALRVREKLLLRQVDVIASQCQAQSDLADEIKFIPNGEIDIMESIRSFGKFNLPHLNFANDLYVSEDYICPDVDHDTMYKCLNTKDEVDTNVNLTEDPEVQNEEQRNIASEVFDRRILKENMETINESIIDLTLRETKELIKKVAKRAEHETKNETKNVPATLERATSTEKRVCLNTKEKVAQGSQTELVSSGKYKKPNITINNCNGTINLKNIANLTINCSGQTSIQTAQKANIATAMPANCVESDVISSTFQSDGEEQFRSKDDEEIVKSKDSENNSIDCEFYNRLIKEIKNTIKSHQRSQKDTNDAHGNRVCSPSSIESNGNDPCNRKMLLKNFENLKIVLENNENDTHPVQIEQWLTEIISETEIEPMQNTGILEHSKFCGKNLC